MLLNLILLSMSVQPVAEAPSLEQEIVVTAQRARQFRYRVGINRRSKATECKILRSSGDKVLDARLCQMAVTCVPSGIEPRGKPSPELVASLRACIEPRERAIVMARAAERTASAPGR